MLRKLLDHIETHLERGKPLHFLYRFFEAADTFFYSPKNKAQGTVHVRDMIDFKRLMTMVLIALGPCILVAFYNTGYQANHMITDLGGEPLNNWSTWLLNLLGDKTGYNLFDPGNILACMLHGALYFVPVYIVTMAVGIAWEVLFATVRGHEVNEGFFVTGMLLPLTLPPTIPLWQVAVAVTFGVVIGKEVFGGTGRNFLNPALTARVLLFLAYARYIVGDLTVWVAAKMPAALPDGISGATPLGLAMNPDTGGTSALVNSNYTWLEAFLGRIPGSMGETSVVACLFGAVFLIIIGVASWRIMVSMLAGAVAICLLCNATGSETNLAMSVGPHWHLVLGGFAFGLVFMATDPVTASMTRTGQYIYGVLIGVMVLLIRVGVGYPEGVMLAILFGNMCAPLIDHYVVKAHLRRRELRTVSVG